MDHVNEGYVTIAFGSQRYLSQALALRASLDLVGDSRAHVLVTDMEVSASSGFTSIISLKDEGGRSLFHKLLLDQYSPFDRTMFIDSDCLVVRPLDDIWERCAGIDFAVVGREVANGRWFGGEISTFRSRLGIPGPIAKFNSGWIFWTRGSTAAAVFRSARLLWGEYERLGIGQFRKGLAKADEPIISLAMALSEVHPIPDDGRVMNTPIGLNGRFRVSLQQGVCEFRKNGVRVNPAIVHFCGSFTRSGHYLREAEFALKARNAKPRVRRRLHRSLAVRYFARCALDVGWIWSCGRIGRSALRRVHSATFRVYS